MAYLYFDDDSPFAEEFENNYIYFNEKDPEAYRKAVKMLKNQKLRKKDPPKDKSSEGPNPSKRRYK